MRGIEDFEVVRAPTAGRLLLLIVLMSASNLFAISIDIPQKSGTK
jgi:hypothetical protein